MSKKEKSFIQKIVFYIKEGLRQFANACASFVGIMAEDYSPKINPIYKNDVTKSAIRDLRQSIRMKNHNLRKTSQKFRHNFVVQNTIKTTQQSADFQASKRRLVTRIQNLQAKINRANRQRSE